jgi:hypothetical protein
MIKLKCRTCGNTFKCNGNKLCPSSVKISKVCFCEDCSKLRYGVLGDCYIDNGKEKVEFT